MMDGMNGGVTGGMMTEMGLGMLTIVMFILAVGFGIGYATARRR